MGEQATLDKVCVAPVRSGPNKDGSARGTLAGYERHRKRGEAACAPCLQAAVAVAQKWARANPEKTRASSLRWARANPEKVAARSQNYYKKNREKVAARQLRWYEANHEEAAARGRRYCEANPEKAKARYRRYYAANLEKVAAKHRRWHAANRERAAATGRRWREANPGKSAEYSRAWYAANPEKNAEKHRRRRARELNAFTIVFTQEQLDARMSMFGHLCWMCGGPFEHVDHVIALARGGPHVLANLRPACSPCNTAKGSKDWRVAN